MLQILTTDITYNESRTTVNRNFKNKTPKSYTPTVN